MNDQVILDIRQALIDSADETTRSGSDRYINPAKLQKCME